MTKTTIWHNPRCSKSRQTLALLEENDVSPEVVLYLDTPPSTSELRKVLKMLGLAPRELMRKGESLYKELALAEVEDNNALLQAMADNPKLIERPVVIRNGQARIGRPPESVLEIL